MNQYPELSFGAVLFLIAEALYVLFIVALLIALWKTRRQRQRR